MPERRREPRFAPENPVPAEIRAADGSTPVLRGHATDLSGGGLRIHLEHADLLGVNQPVSVRLLPEDDEPELIEGTIRRLANGVVHVRADVLSHLDGADPVVRQWAV